jgi:hypothetical protein
MEKILSNPARARYPDVPVPVFLISQLDSIEMARLLAPSPTLQARFTQYHC